MWFVSSSSKKNVKKQKQKVGGLSLVVTALKSCSFPSISCCNNPLQLSKIDSICEGCKGKGQVQKCSKPRPQNLQQSRTERQRGVGRASIRQLSLPSCFAFAEEMRAELLDVRGCDRSDPKRLFGGA